MAANDHSDIQALFAVARERSFSRAAAKLGVTPSALSHKISGLEQRVGIRLLSRTTRSVAPTEAGERFIAAVAPLYEQIDAEIDALGELREKPAGTVRITCNDYVIDTIFRPRLSAFLAEYPDIHVEFAIDYGFTDIVGQRFDAGVRLGEAISKDMIAVRIGPDWRFAIVGSPAYFERRDRPETPQELTNHNCITLRLTTAGGIYAWELKNGDREVNARVGGQLTFNSIVPVLNAALDGHGLAHVPEELAKPHIEAGRLVEVLEEWNPYWQGYHLYYPSRRHTSPAFTKFIEAYRFRG